MLGKGNYYLKKTLLIMKITTFFLMLNFIQLNATVFSQSQKFSFSFENIQVKELLDQIETKSTYKFLYRPDQVDNYTVKIEAKDKTLEELLTVAFSKSEMTFRILEDNLVVITPIDFVSFKQEVKVEGTITDATNGEPVIGASVIVEGTSIGAITDAAGKFSITVPGLNSVIIISSIGYNNEKISIDGRSVIDVKLVPDITKLDEVVVVGYGTMRKSDLTGAVVSVSSDALKNTVSSTFDQALQGRAAGVQVMVNSGQPGAATTIRIRGTNSLLGNNEPLYVIDGIQIGGSNEGVFFVGNGGNRNAYRTSPLSALNPSDIESIEILKDASASAIYGNKGANGVIIVTTKKGRKNEARISYDYSTGIKTLTNKIDVMGLQDFASFNNEQALVQGKTPRPEFANPNTLKGGTDWQNTLFKTGKVQNHNLSLSGGTDKMTYFISGGYNYDYGPVINSWMERYSFRANTEVKMKKWLNFGNNFSFGHTNTKYVMADAGDSPLMLSLTKAPDVKVFDDNGNYIGVNPGQEVPGGGLAQANPVALTKDRDSRKKKFNVYNNAYVDLLYKDFTLKTEVNITGDFTNDYAFYARSEYPGFINNQSQLNEQLASSLGYELKNILSYNKTLGDHSVNAMAAHEARGGKYQNVFGAGGAFYNNNLNSLGLSNSKYINTGGNRGRWRAESYLTRIFYNFKDLAMLTTSLRADGSPNFPKNNRWGYFPSFSAAVKVSNLAFFKNNVTFINKLKINGGYGEVGSDNVLGGLYIPYVGVQPTTDGGFSTSFLNYDNNLRWETTTSSNLGLEMGFFQNRLNFQLELYKKKTTDALNQVLLPSSVGSGIYVVSNIASIQNKGIELTLNTINTNGEFSWKTDVTFTVNRNEILSLGEGGLPLYGGISKNMEGGPIGRFWGYQTDGLYKDFDDIATSARWNGVNTIDSGVGLWMGDYKFKDIDKETGIAKWEIPGYTGSYDANGVYIPGTAIYTGNASDKIDIKDASIINADDQTYIGDPNPDFTFGINNNFEYKNFDLTVYIVGVYGNDLYNSTKARLLSGDLYNQNMLSIMKDRAIPELKNGGNAGNIFDYSLKNPNAEVPRLRAGTNFSQASVNSRFVEDGSYLRIQNIVLGYNLPNSLVNKFKLSNLRVYVNAQNLFTFTKYSGWDPEVGSTAQSSLSTGIDGGHYPVARVMMMGIQVGF